MSDDKETGQEPTEREREIAFAPHHSPRRQADGDPGRKTKPELNGDGNEASAGERRDEQGDAQADGDPR